MQKSWGSTTLTYNSLQSYSLIRMCICISQAYSLGKYSDENSKHPQLVSTNATAIASSAEAIFYSTSDKKVNHGNW